MSSEKVEQILKDASGRLEDVIVIGKTIGGGAWEDWSLENDSQVFFMLERMKFRMLSEDFLYKRQD